MKNKLLPFITTLAMLASLGHPLNAIILNCPTLVPSDYEGGAFKKSKNKFYYDNSNIQKTKVIIESDYSFEENQWSGKTEETLSGRYYYIFILQNISNPTPFLVTQTPSCKYTFTFDPRGGKIKSIGVDVIISPKNHSYKNCKIIRDTSSFDCEDGE